MLLAVFLTAGPTGRTYIEVIILEAQLYRAT